MKKDFWLKAWQNNDIGFHLPEVNPVLLRCKDKLRDLENANVFVPLCGKTLDLLWFGKHSKKVYGVELSEKAILDFFRENNLEYTLSEEKKFKIYQSGNIFLYCGDLYDFPLEKLEIDIVFDRGCSVALPEDLRKKFYDTLDLALKKGALWLMCTFIYPNNIMEGPPFSISKTDLETQVADNFHIEVLEELESTAFELEDLKEGAYLLSK